jgi:dihydrofolate reductase
MGRLVVTEFITLDGVAEDPGGAEKTPGGGWAFRFDRGEAGARFKTEELEDADAQLLGRTTYDGFAEAWPKMRGDAFGEKFNAMPKHVVTSSALDPEWENSTPLAGELGEAVPALTARYSGNVLVNGSISLVRALTELGLVDEYRLMVYPVLLGSGRRLFADGIQRSLRITHTEPAGDTLLITLVPRGD